MRTLCLLPGVSVGRRGGVAFALCYSFSVAVEFALLKPLSGGFSAKCANACVCVCERVAVFSYGNSLDCSPSSTSASRQRRKVKEVPHTTMLCLTLDSVCVCALAVSDYGFAAARLVTGSCASKIVPSALARTGSPHVRLISCTQQHQHHHQEESGKRRRRRNDTITNRRQCIAVKHNHEHTHTQQPPLQLRCNVPVTVQNRTISKESVCATPPQHREAAAVVHTRSALTLCAYLLFLFTADTFRHSPFLREHTPCVSVCVNYRLHGVKVRKSAKREKGNFAAFHLVRGTHTKQRRRRTLEPPIILVLLLQFVVRFFKVTGCVGDHNQSKQPEVRLSIDNPTIFSCCVCVV